MEKKEKELSFEESIKKLETIVKEGIQVKLLNMPDKTKYKLIDILTKIINKGSNNLIAIVI